MQNQEENYYPLRQPEEIPIREREDAMAAYFMMFASLAAGLPLPIINIIAAIIYYYLNKDKGRFVQFHSLQSLLSQIPVSLINAVAVFWLASVIFSESLMSLNNNFLIYIIFVIIVNISYFGCSIYAAIKARSGRMVYFIFFGKFSYERIFRQNFSNQRNQVISNLPPR